MVAPVSWKSFLWVSLEQGPYDLGSVLGPQILGNFHLRILAMLYRLLRERSFNHESARIRSFYPSQGPIDHITIRISHSDSKAQYKACQKSWFVGSLCIYTMCYVPYTPYHILYTMYYIPYTTYSIVASTQVPFDFHGLGLQLCLR